jgi:hypothetical protein
MYDYQKIPKTVGKGLKNVVNTAGTILASPLTLPGIRPLTKTVIKGGLFLTRKTESFYEEIEGGWSNLVEEAKHEMEQKTPKESVHKKRSTDYETWHVDELYELAQELEIKGRSNMKKEELISTIRQATKGEK